MNLSLRISGTFTPDPGEKRRAIVYDVAGMPHGQAALIGLRTNGRWTLTRIRRQGTYSILNEYDTPKEALKAIQALMDFESREAMDIRAQARGVIRYGG